MTDLHDPTDDLIRDAVHELVGAAPGPKPLPEPVTDNTSRRRLAVAASIIAVVAMGGAAIALLNRGDQGTIITPADTVDPGPQPTAPGVGGGLYLVAVTVIARDPDGVSQRIEIDRGSDDGVFVGMPVMARAGLVGEVIEVFPRTSLVTLVTDISFATGVLAIDEAGTTVGPSGIVNGTGGELLVQSGGTDWLDAEQAAEAVFVYAVNARQGWPENGLPVGRIVDRRSDGALEIEPLADLDVLDEIWVLSADPPSAPATPEPMLEETFGGPTPAALTREVVPISDGTPWTSTGVVEHLVELGGRRMVWAREPSGAAFLYFSAWVDDGDGWQFLDLTDQFRVVDEGEQPVVGDWPVAIATDGSSAVAVGADATIDGVGMNSSPRIWVSNDLLTWDTIELAGVGRLTDVVADAEGWVAVGEVDGEWRMLRSDDGRDWAASLGVAPTEPGIDPTAVSVGGVAVGVFGDRIRTTFDVPDGRTAVGTGGGTLVSAGGGTAIEFDPDARSLSRSTDGIDWSILDVPMDWLDPDLDPRRLQFAHIAIEDSLLVTDGVGLWKLRPGEPPQQYDLTQHLPDTEWGPSYITGLQVLGDGTVVVLGAIPHQPGTKPINELVVLTSDGDPAARARDAAVRALVAEGFVDIGGDHDIPGSATFGVENADGEVVTGTFTTVESDRPTNTLGLCNGYTMTISATTGALATRVSDIVERALRC